LTCTGIDVFYIAEEGGIGALLSLGKVSSKHIQYKASLTVGHMAKNAYGQLDSSGDSSGGG
jgi:hypothetical protein